MTAVRKVDMSRDTLSEMVSNTMQELPHLLSLPSQDSSTFRNTYLRPRNSAWFAPRSKNTHVHQTHSTSQRTTSSHQNFPSLTNTSTIQPTSSIPRLPSLPNL